jgi:hypothetical protein
MMPATRTRKEARERLLQTFLAAVERIIPQYETKPLRGSTFSEWDDQATALKRAIIPTLLEERAALEPSARVEQGGYCPYCGLDSVYLEKQVNPAEVTGADGPVVFEKQNCRCRTCDGSFSPSVP